MNIGFLGCSNIAVEIIKALSSIEDVVLYGCSARDPKKARDFSIKYKIKKYYESYKDMLLDDNIDLVYVSTLTSSHYKDTLLALQYKKPCIVEKAFTQNYKEAEDLIYYSEKHNIYLTEAIWTRYMPYRRLISELLKTNAIGPVYHVEANLSYPLTTVQRLMNKDMGGGALLDLGVYLLNFITMFFGYNIKTVRSIMTLDKDTEVDRTTQILLTYSNGITANLFTSIEGLSTKNAIIYGTDGMIKVDNANNPMLVEIYKVNSNNTYTLTNQYEFSHTANGYEYEFIDAINDLKNHQIESNSMLHSESLKIMNLIENIQENSIKVKK